MDLGLDFGFVYVSRLGFGFVHGFSFFFRVGARLRFGSFVNTRV